MRMPARVMGAVLNLPTHQLLEQSVNLGVMYGSSQLHSWTDSFRHTATVHSLLKGMLYLLFSHRTHACKHHQMFIIILLA